MNNKPKQVTIYDIAKELSISAATVSRALTNTVDVKPDTRERVINAAKKMGYHTNNFASSLRKKQGQMIGVIVPKLNSHFMAEALSGIERTINEAGYNLIISQSHESLIAEVTATKGMLKNRVDGLLVSLCFDNNTTKHFDELINHGIPVVFFDRTSNSTNYESVKIDNFKAAYDITIHLIEQSCKRILHITANQLRDVFAERLQGYKQALKDKHIPYNEDLVLITDLSPQSGMLAAQHILKMDNTPDAVFATNDFFAITCMRELQKAGIRVPEDIAFAGFNNDLLSTLVVPTLTTVNYDGVQMGQLAAKALLQKLNDRSAPNHNLLMPYQIVIRNSSQKL